MDYMILFTLLTLGFIVGLSGAMIPGPLLVFVISDSMKKGRWSGPLTILGHVIVEVFTVAFIVYGLGPLIVSYTGWIFLSGGLMLTLMSSILLKNSGSLPDFRPRKTKVQRKHAYSSITGGMAFTLFNPSFPLWWATAGYALLLKGEEMLGFIGLALVVLGHWGADLIYYSAVSSMISRGRGDTLKKIYRPLMILLFASLSILGACFIYQGAASIGILLPPPS